MPAKARVAITGLGVVSAAGNSLSANISALEKGILPSPCPPPFATEFPYPVLCAADPPAVAGEGYTRSLLLARMAALEASACAGLAPNASEAIGLAVGTSVGASLDFFPLYAARAKGEATDLSEIYRYVRSNPATGLARLLAFKGPALCVTNACSSGTDAIGIAAQWIRDGICPMALAGGADALSPVTYAGFSSLRLPSRALCKPFDAKRSGLTLGEGAAFVVLESEASRAARGARALAFVEGYGTATDAYHLTAPHPQAEGLARAAEKALAEAGASWQDIAFINVHGTGTAANDAAEAAFIRNACASTPFIATKGLTGHTLGAAGAIEAAFVIAHLAAQALPASPNFHEPDPELGLAPVQQATPVVGNLAASFSLAFGGNNSVLVLGAGESAL